MIHLKSALITALIVVILIFLIFHPILIVWGIFLGSFSAFILGIYSTVYTGLKGYNHVF